MIARMRLAVGVLALAAGVSAQAEPPLPPPYAGAYQPQGVDEQGLWREMDEEERRFAQSDMIIRDPTLQAYVTKVLCDTVGQDRCDATRIYIVRVPMFNASMSPNGLIQVYSGLLLRVHSEAELGAVLGHEFGHFEARHSLERLKAQRSGGDVLAWAGVLASLAPSYDMLRTYRNLQLTIIGSIYRFNRDQEREADGLGISYLNTSALRPQAAAQVWERLMAEFTADARAKGLKKPRFDRIPFYSTHPPEAERATTLALLARPEAATRDDGAARYRAALAPWLPQLLDDQIKLNDFGASEYIIQSLAESGWTAPLWHARGELYRLRGAPRDLVHAAQFYDEAIALDPAHPEAHRGLGLALLKTGQAAAGQKALLRYLELKPDAADAKLIGMMIPKEVPAP
ncbi:MAG: peptidase M48 [Sphingomonadales bacterium RIFCSPHIGHO2_01_FULL_65_20]|jgi:predicted Zn-dependent protease|uniref:M48 family metallopeptidase n=2 Tax=Blastomonas TaxID=150203 RepID=UPI00082FE94F|nr:M48 family metalloprotease [Blastomonas sp.]OHC97856.1 MAG: peptidase M48 [Sphingomonadales bacterium RIFCSPHIGHO2_01_FULL_65_20]